MTTIWVAMMKASIGIGVVAAMLGVSLGMFWLIEKIIKSTRAQIVTGIVLVWVVMVAAFYFLGA
jgi:hypothetical protein